jgi:hypothetical protein
MPAPASASFGGNWTCQGTVVTIDDDDVKTGCTVPALTVVDDGKTFSWDGRIRCADGTDAPFTEADSVHGASVVDGAGSVIGKLSATDFSSNFLYQGLTYATTMRLGKTLHFQHDRVSQGVPLLRWTFDCIPQ